MWIYKPSNKIFENRKEAKKYFGAEYFRLLLKDKNNFEFINDNIAANGSVCENS